MIKYFVERIDTNEWFYYTFDPVESDKCTHCKCVQYSYLRFEDGRTNDPHKAMHYDSKEDAQKAIWFGYTNEREKNLIVTEHEFVDSPTS